MRVFDDYEVAEEELLNHIGIFMENNASLLKHKVAGEDGVTEEEDDGKLDARFSGQQHAHGNKAGGMRRQQPSIKIRENAGLRKVKKSQVGINQQLLEPVKKSKKAKAPRPSSPQFNTSLSVDKPEAKPKKKKAGKGGLSSLNNIRGDSSSLADLQSVEEFRHFLLHNDS